MATPVPESAIVGDPGRQYRLLSGTIRNAGSGWEFIDDTAHRPCGFTGLTQHADCIELHHDVGATMVSSFQVTPDEAYAGRGLRVGASVDLTVTRLFLFASPGTPSRTNPALVTASSGNLWLTAVMEL